MSARTRAYLVLTFVAFIWGIAAIVIKYTLQYFQPYTFLTYRFWISFLIVLPFAYREFKKHQINLSQYKEVALLTTIGIPINLILVFIGINLTSALEASFILSVEPLFSMIGGALFLKEKIQKNELIGFLVATLGTVLIILQPVFQGESLNFSNLSGNLILMASNVTLAYYTVRSRRDLQHKFSPWFITIIGFILAPILLTPLSFTEQPFSQLIQTLIDAPFAAHLGVFFMAVFSGIIAYYLYEYGLKRITASESGIFHYLGPLFAAPLAVVWLKEPLTLPFIAGALVTLLGVFIVEYRPHRHQHHHIIKFLNKLNPREKLALTFLIITTVLQISTRIFITILSSYNQVSPRTRPLDLLIFLNGLLIIYCIQRKHKRLPFMPKHFFMLYGLTITTLAVILAYAS